MATSTPQERSPAPAQRASRVRERWELLGAASLVGVTCLWIITGGATEFQDAATRPTSAGRLLGWIATQLLLWQVLLMARIPPLERAFGQDRLVRIHRLVGMSSVWAMLGHIIATTWGYAAGSSWWGQFWSLLTTYPGMLLAAAGSALILMVALTSARVARARMNYESWHLLHLYAYLGIALSLPHQLWTGTALTSDAASNAWWWAWVLATLASVVYWRVGRLVGLNLRHRVRVARIVQESPTVASVELEGRDLHKLRAKAGQFFVWRFAGPGWTRGNPYSLSRAPESGSWRITVGSAGEGSGRVATLRPGTRVFIEGPYGTLTAARRTRPRAVLIAAGVGITPVRALLEGMQYQPGEVALLWRGRSEDELVLRGEIEALAAQRGFTITYLLGPRHEDRRLGWMPRTCTLNPSRGGVEVIEALLGDLAGCDVYACGPEPWLDVLEAGLALGGMERSQVHVERFSW